jgi:uncharacterized protein (DUF2164 family)
MEIVLNLNSVGNALDLIKYCTLYFDKLKIDSPFAIDSFEKLSDTPNNKGQFQYRINFTSYISDSIEIAKKMLVEEDICIDAVESSFGKYSKLAKKIVVKNSHLFFPSESFTMHKNSMEIRSDAEIILDEAKQAVSEIILQEDRRRIQSVTSGFEYSSDVPDFYLLLNLYKGLVDLLLTHIENGDNVITNSSVTNKILLNYYSSHSNKLRKAGLKYNFAQIEATKILLPFVQNAPLDDILEIRYKANDELLELRNYVETTLKSLNMEAFLNLSSEEIGQMLNQKITPSIKQFERKLEGLNVFTAQEFIKNMANPLYYSPMLTTFFTNVPAIASMGFSLGVISLQSFLQRKSKKLELQDDPLYFTVKMRNQL